MTIDHLEFDGDSHTSVSYFLGMTVLFGIRTSLYKFPIYLFAVLNAPQSELGHVLSFELKLELVRDEGDELRIRGFDILSALCYTNFGNCTTVRFGRIDRGLFTCRRGKVSFFICVYGLYKKVKPFIGLSRSAPCTVLIFAIAVLYLTFSKIHLVGFIQCAVF